jgi:hypothetical protein
MRANVSEEDLLASAETIYRMGEDWLQFDNKVQIVDDPVYNPSGRILISGDDYPKETDTATAISGAGPYPAATRRLGISAPSAALTHSITVAGTGTDREIAYCYTRVGERADGTVVESAPSPSTAVFTAKDDATVQLSDFVDASETGVYTTHFRIYRINTGDTGAEFQFVDDLVKTTSPLEYDDTVADEDLGEVLPTATWTAPIDELKGFVAGSGGLIFAFNANTVYVSDTYIPYAFPSEYTLTAPSEIVGMGFNGTSMVVLTKTNPVLLFGTDPGSITVERFPVVLPCKSARSIVSIPGGVVFASTFGLYLIDSGGNPVNLTKDIFTDQQWSDLEPGRIFAFFHKGAYQAFFSGSTMGIEFNPGSNEIRRFRSTAYVWGGRYVSTVMINTYEFLTSDSEEFVTSGGSGLYCSGGAYPLTYDTLYLIQTKGTAREVVAFDSGDETDYIWTSKTFYLMRQHILSAGRVVGDLSEGVTLSLYVDDTLHFTKSITSDSVFRIPRVMGSTFKIKLTGKAHIEQVIIGASISEVTQNA